MNWNPIEMTRPDFNDIDEETEYLVCDSDGIYSVARLRSVTNWKNHEIIVWVDADTAYDFKPQIILNVTDWMEIVKPDK